MPEREQLRTLQQVWEEGVWPSGGGLSMGPDPFESFRHQAIADVLCCMPEVDYQKLKELSDDYWFQWFIPPERTCGFVSPFTVNEYPEKTEGKALTWVPYARVLYLSPRLEKLAWSTALATVAHEVAHIVLRHEVLLVLPDEYKAHEKAAWELAAKWEYGKEVKRHLATHKWRDSWEQTYIQELKQRREDQFADEGTA